MGAALQEDAARLLGAGNGAGPGGHEGPELSGGGSEGYTDAKTTQQTAALAAAEPVLSGIRALQLDAPRPTLKAMATLTMSDLKNMRDQEQVDTLTELYALALPLADELAEEQVTAKQLKALDDTAELYRPLVGTPRQEIVSGSVLLKGAEDQLDAARAALERLDVRVPNLKSTMPDFVREYFRLRAIVDAGHGPKGGGQE